MLEFVKSGILQWHWQIWGYLMVVGILTYLGCNKNPDEFYYDLTMLEFG
jgi:hypothetical protein